MCSVMLTDIPERRNMTNTLENNQETYSGAFGEVRIADDVVASIAGLVALEVEGVDSMVSAIQNTVVSKLGMNNPTQGVKVEILDNRVKARLSVVLKNNVQAIQVCEKVQERVKSAIESMTGLDVYEVNVKVEGIK